MYTKLLTVGAIGVLALWLGTQLDAHSPKTSAPSNRGLQQLLEPDQILVLERFPSSSRFNLNVITKEQAKLFTNSEDLVTVIQVEPGYVIVRKECNEKARPFFAPRASVVETTILLHSIDRFTRYPEP